MPGGVTHASVRRSYNPAAVRSPRFALTAVWIGFITCISTNTMPVKVSGPPSACPFSTAPTRTPIAIANSAGSTPRSSSTAHHRIASVRSARGSTPKNFHSCRSRNDPNIARHLVARPRAEEVEAQALIVDALGVAARVVVRHREHLAAESAHALHAGGDVV